MKNKRGFLLAEETLKIIIALISISFLVYFLTALYFANQNSEELEQAKASLERLEEIILGLSEEESSESDIAPQGWSLFSFIEEERPPNTCAGKNCLCICDEVIVDNALFGYISGRQANECSESGACLIVPNLNSFEEIEIIDSNDGLTKISIEKQNNEISIKEVNSK